MKKFIVALGTRQEWVILRVRNAKVGGSIPLGSINAVPRKVNSFESR